ncbi:short chain dehydrogenase [Stachybotrys elegans]|uniref:Short chain dehydrogenase n=1 Tax=Stachybotrys elegans TaxID=80388 RepID=A0A8K0WPB4_9HYPO|nr:short chain dehydrogenase [Stachybotrys elegans]
MDTTSLFKVEGMVAVITGGGSGIGLVMAKALAGAGATKVYILGRRQGMLEAAAAAHPNIRPLVCDVTSRESLRDTVAAVTSEVGYVNLVVANSGILGPVTRFRDSASISELRGAMFDETSMEEFTNTMHVNVTGAWYTMLAFLELLDAGNKNALKGGFGAPLSPESKVPSIQSQVVFIASVAAFSRQRATAQAYGASKSAIHQLAMHAATNLAQYQIRVNTMAPGYFPSEMTTEVFATRDPETEAVTDESFMPARRFGTDQEMAGSILYLAGRAGAYCNGLTLLNDGGRIAVVPATY